MLKVTSIALCLMALASCSTTERVVSKASLIREHVPSVLLKPCPKKSRKPIVKTGDIIDRLLATESSLAKCSAQVDGIRKWNSQ